MIRALTVSALRDRASGTSLGANARPVTRSTLRNRGEGDRPFRYPLVPLATKLPETSIVGLTGIA